MANRKLQGDIDRTLKKVYEGVDVFNEIWEKVYSAPNQTQKEKYESDLKKEIKKLQRFRDQIKNWLSNSEIRDKRELTNTRKLIETQMERFKHCERETKTKAYSKEGLAQGERLDPTQQAKLEKRSWMEDVISQLNTQVEEFEFEVENIQSRSRKKSSNEQVEALEKRIDRHKWHLDKLEQILRLLENDEVSVEDIENIQEDIQHYTDNSGEPDFVEDEFIYDSFNLADEDGVDATSEADEKSVESTPNSSPSIGKAKKAQPTSSETPIAPVSSPSISGMISIQPALTQPRSRKGSKPESKVESTPAQPPEANLAIQPALLSRSEETKTNSKASKDKKAKPKPPSPHIVPKEDKEPQSKPISEPSKAIHSPSIPKHPDKPAQKPQKSVKSAPLPSRSPSPPRSTPSPTPSPSPSPSPTPSPTPSPSPSPPPPPPPDSSPNSTSANEKEVPLSVAPRQNPTNKQTPASYDPASALLALESSLPFIPTSRDSFRPKRYESLNPRATPPCFPSAPSPLFDNPAMFEKFDLDTLFFIFYYQQRSYQQYLAAKELKKQSWRFHKTYYMWFQRSDEPKVTTEEYEQGTYLYFDQNTGWCQRIKSDFTFEYTHLEDELGT